MWAARAPPRVLGEAAPAPRQSCVRGRALPASSTMTGLGRVGPCGPVKVVSRSWAATSRTTVHVKDCQNRLTRSVLVRRRTEGSAYSLLRRCKNWAPSEVRPEKGCVTKGWKAHPASAQGTAYFVSLPPPCPEGTFEPLLAPDVLPMGEGGGRM